MSKMNRIAIKTVIKRLKAMAKDAAPIMDGIPPLSIAAPAELLALADKLEKAL